MRGEYRITVRGVVSERFCQGLPGMQPPRADDRTVLEGGPGGRPVNEVLADARQPRRRGPRRRAAGRRAHSPRSAEDVIARQPCYRAGHGGSSPSPSPSSPWPWSSVVPSPPTSPAPASRTRRPSSSPRATTSAGRRGPTPNPGVIALVSTGQRRPLRRGPAEVERAARPPSPTDPDVAPGRHRLRRRRPALISKDGTAVVRRRLHEPISRRRGRGRRRAHPRRRSSGQPGVKRRRRRGRRRGGRRRSSARTSPRPRCWPSRSSSCCRSGSSAGWSRRCCPR